MQRADEEPSYAQTADLSDANRNCDILFYRAEDPTPCTQMTACNSDSTVCSSWYGTVTSSTTKDTVDLPLLHHTGMVQFTLVTHWFTSFQTQLTSVTATKHS